MKLLFLGDFFFDYDIIPNDFLLLCDFIKRNNYYVILNLETTFGNKGNPINKRGVHLRGSYNLIEVLKQLNVIAVCLANNHCMDFGYEALEELIINLKKENILFVGAGKNL
ncbi:MAG: CapA family protein, partial [Elusimicrobia bacterium]|nr:CapA family protein [Elusimicrobiota bacterium]